MNQTQSKSFNCYQLNSLIKQYIKSTTAKPRKDDSQQIYPDATHKGIFIDESDAKHLAYILNQIIERRSKGQQWKQVIKFKNIWTPDNNYSCMNSHIKQNLKNQNQNDVSRQTQQKYIAYVTARHFKVLQILKNQQNSVELPKYYNIHMNQEKHQIDFEMELGLIIPRVYNKKDEQCTSLFFSHLSKKVKQKLIVEISQCISKLNSLHIQHNDIRLENIIYSIVDNRFKSIDFDMARIRNNVDKQANITFFQIFNQAQIKGKNSQFKISDKLYYKNNSQKCLKFEQSQIKQLISSSNQFYKIMENNCGKIDSIMFGNLLIQLYGLYQNKNQQSHSSLKQVLILSDLSDFLSLSDSNQLLNQISENISQDNLNVSYIFDLVVPSLFTRSTCSQFLKKINKHFINEESLEHQQQTCINQNQYNQKQSIEQSIDSFLNDTTHLIIQLRSGQQSQLYGQNINLSSQASRMFLNSPQNDTSQTIIDLLNQNQKIMIQSQTEQQKFVLESPVKNMQKKQKQTKQEQQEQTKINQLKRLLQFQQKLYPQKNHEEIMRTKLDLGKQYLNYGLIEEGQRQIKDCKQVFSGDKQIQLKNLQIQAFRHELQNQFQKALMGYKKKMQIFYQIKNTTRQFAHCLISMANMELMKGNYNRSISGYEEAENILKIQLKRKDVSNQFLNQVFKDMKNCRKSMGLYFQRIGNYQRSKNMYLEGILLKNSKSINVDYIILLIIIAQIQNKSGNYLKAIEWFQQSQKSRRSLKEISLNSKSQMLIQIGKFYLNNGQYQQALLSFCQCQKVQKKIRSIHMNYLFNLHSISITYMKMRQYNKSLVTFISCYQLFFKMIQYKYSSFISQQNLICFFDKMQLQQKKNAILKIIAGLFDIKQIEDLTNPLNSVGLSSLGQLFLQTNQFQLSLQYFNLALKIRQLRGQTNNLFSAAIFNNIAKYHINKDNEKQALEYLEKAFQIKQKIVGENHLQMASSYQGFGFYYRKLQKYQEALLNFDRALQIRMKSMRPDHPNILQTIQKINQCRQLVENLKNK